MLEGVEGGRGVVDGGAGLAAGARQHVAHAGQLQDTLPVSPMTKPLPAAAGMRVTRVEAGVLDLEGHRGTGRPKIPRTVAALDADEVGFAAVIAFSMALGTSLALAMPRPWPSLLPTHAMTLKRTATGVGHALNHADLDHVVLETGQEGVLDFTDGQTAGERLLREMISPAMTLAKAGTGLLAQSGRGSGPRRRRRRGPS